MVLWTMLACTGSSLAPAAEVWDYDSNAPPLTVYTVVGDSYDDGLGESLATGDVDGDGWAEVVTGAPFSADDGHWSGTAYLFGAPLLGAEGEVLVADAPSSWTGEEVRDQLAGAVSLAPGVTHDRADLLVGARYNDAGGTASGRAYLVSLAAGPTGQRSISASRWSFTGEDSGDYAGQAVLGAGDVDGGGVGDLFVSAPGSDEGGSSAGKVYLLRGEALGALGEVPLWTASATWRHEEATAELGSGLFALGDVSGDGLTDVAMVAPRADLSGSIYLLMGEDLTGADGAGDLDQLSQLPVAKAGDGCGAALAGDADLDRDGLAELVVGCPGDDEGGTDAGTVLIFAAGNLAEPMLRLDGSGSEGAGAAVAAGDVDGDAQTDLLVGAPQASHAWVMLGADLDQGVVELDRSAWTLEGESGSDLGHSVALADLDGDGLADPLLSAPEAQGGTGVVYILLANGLQRNGKLEL